MQKSRNFVAGIAEPELFKSFGFVRGSGIVALSLFCRKLFFRLMGYEDRVIIERREPVSGAAPRRLAGV